MGFFRLFAFILGAAFTLPVLAFDNFITRDGHRLMDGKAEFRFAGIHAPELHRIEDDARGPCKADPRGWGQYFHWPTAEEQENWIKALVYTGHKAMRVYVLSRSEEHTSELQSRENLVCRLLLEKKNTKRRNR